MLPLDSSPRSFQPVQCRSLSRMRGSDCRFGVACSRRFRNWTKLPGPMSAALTDDEAVKHAEGSIALPAPRHVLLLAAPRISVVSAQEVVHIGIAVRARSGRAVVRCTNPQRRSPAASLTPRGQLRRRCRDDLPPTEPDPTPSQTAVPPARSFTDWPTFVLSILSALHISLSPS